jgi:hypothetical protein
MNLDVKQQMLPLCRQIQHQRLQTLAIPILNAVRIQVPSPSRLTGGVNPLTYSITRGAPFFPNNNFTGLGAGTYTVVVHSANGCEDSQDVTIDQTALNPAMYLPQWCPGDTIFIGGDTIVSGGLHDILLPGGAANGCDSLIHLNVTLLPLLQTTIQASICEGDTFSIGGKDFLIGGNYTGR